MSIPTQPVPASPDKSRNIILAFFAVFTVLLLIGAVAAVNGFQKTRAGAEPVAEQFLTAIEKHDYPAAHRLMSPPAQAATSTTQIADVVALLEKQRGSMTGHGEAVNFFAGINNGQSYAKATYQESYRNGQKGVTVMLVYSGGDGGKWEVQSFNYQL